MIPDSDSQPDARIAHASPPAAPTGTPTRVASPSMLIEEALDKVVASMGYELVHAEFSGSGKHRRLVIFLDKADKTDGGISLDDCTKMSPVISSTLDAAELAAAEAQPGSDPALARLLGAPYLLEVSSPGIDRPLSKRSHFARHIGGLAKITTFSAIEAGSKQKNFNGRIDSVQPPSAPDGQQDAHDDRAGSVTIVDPDGGARYIIGLDQIRKANLVYEG